MTTLIPFNYDGLDAETRIVVRQKTTEIRAMMRRTAADIVEIGTRLLEIKASLPHGAFLTWLLAEFPGSEWTARNFMNVANAFKSGTVPDLDLIALRALYLLSAPNSTDADRAEAVERVARGQRVTGRDAAEIIADHAQPDLAELARAAFESLSPAEQADQVRQEEAEALEDALANATPSERERRLERAQEHGAKALNAARALGTEAAKMAWHFQEALVERERLAEFPEPGED